MKLFLRALAMAALLLPTAIFSQSVVGTWGMSVPAEDGSMMPVQAKMSADGTYTIDFGADGVVEVRGKYELSGDQVTVQDVGEGENSCTGVGVYRMEVTEKTLTMTRIKEECPGRGGPDGVMVMTRQ